MPENICLPLESSEFSAPLGGIQSGRLVFASPARQVYLRVSRTKERLYWARFKHQAPGVWLHEGSLTIQYHHSLLTEHPPSAKEPLAEISLNGSLPWEIEFHNGVSHLNAELNGLQLRSLDILGGASHLHLALSEPLTTTFIYISGGINRGYIFRPSGVGLRIRISGGANQLLFDSRSFNAITEEINLESASFKNASSRYDISIIGGASNLTIDERQ